MKHLATQQVVNGKTHTACGKWVSGHGSLRHNIAKVTCQSCIVAVRRVNAPAPVINVEEDKMPRTYEDWTRYVESHGLVELGMGASRVTYALDDERVIKLNYNDWDQCQREVNVWNNSSAELRPYLAAVIDSGPRWIIAERAKFTLAKVDEATSSIIRHDLRDVTKIGDLHAANIGYFGKGQFKILDYAL